VQGASQERRTAEFKVIQACARLGVPLSYADKICRAMNHGATLNDVDARALWKITFTLKQRKLIARRDVPTPRPTAPTPAGSNRAHPPIAAGAL
jgi:hypothetical protein